MAGKAFGSGKGSEAISKGGSRITGDWVLHSFQISADARFRPIADIPAPWEVTPEAWTQGVFDGERHDLDQYSAGTCKQYAPVAQRRWRSGQRALADDRQET